jgi:branched-chain amino acid aminotransferase
MAVQEVDYLWLSGRMVPWQDAAVHPLTHALHYGSGVFEGIRCYETEHGPAVFRLTDHLRRLQRSAKLYYLDIPFELEELRRAVFEVIGANDLRSCYVRPLVFRGYGEMGLVPLEAPVECLVAAWPWDAYLGGDASSAGIRARVSSYRCLDDTSFARTAKASGHYLSGMLAKTEAVKAGYDEAIIMNDHGHVTEGSAENLFMVRDGVVVTPPLADGVLDGLTRDTVLRLLRREGVPVEQRSIGRSELIVADEVFLSGTAAEVVPIREVDYREIGEPGPITRRLQRHYRDVVLGRDSEMGDWLEVVPRNPSRLRQ